MEFVPSTEGLYHYDFQQSIKRMVELERAQAMMIQTVEGIQWNFTKREIEAAEEARRLYVIMGRPSQKVFEEMMSSGKFINNTVTIQDYRNALEMFGQDLGVLKGKTVRTKPEHIAIDVAPKPQPKNIVLSVDLMYFTSLSFLITVSRNIKFITATLLNDRKKTTLFNALKQVFRVYQGRGHSVEDIEFQNAEENPIHSMLSDNEFQALRQDVEDVKRERHSFLVYIGNFFTTGITQVVQW
jgi:hypothetical protein